MIEYIRFNSGYPLHLPEIGNRKIIFRERITVLCGPNGTGKSTILKALAENAGCGEGGWSAMHRKTTVSGHDLTDENIRNNTKNISAAEKENSSLNIAESPDSIPASLKFDADIKWDGKPVFYQDCYADTDISFFNNDFFNENELLRSSGEKRIGLINELINFLEDRFLTYKTGRGEGPTLLLDEVDNHIGFAGQSLLWKFIFPMLAKKYQLIISSHSVFPLLLRRDDVVELSRYYPASCLKELGEAIDKYNKK